MLEVLTNYNFNHLSSAILPVDSSLAARSAVNGLELILTCETFLWILSVVMSDVSIADIYWGPGFALAAFMYASHLPMGLDSLDVVQKMGLAFVTIWAIRLGGYLAYRNIGKPEDKRYADWRRQNPSNFWWSSYFSVFMAQGFAQWIISAPLFALMMFPSAIYKIGTTAMGLNVMEENQTSIALFSLLLWTLGMYFETAADWELMQFKSNPANRNKLCTNGVWGYCRHPNYFGDALVWTSLWILACTRSGGFYTVFSPIILTYLLTNVTGVTLNEQYLARKPGFAQYAANVPAFIPRMTRWKMSEVEMGQGVGASQVQGAGYVPPQAFEGEKKIS